MADCPCRKGYSWRGWKLRVFPCCKLEYEKTPAGRLMSLPLVKKSLCCCFLFYIGALSQPSNQLWRVTHLASLPMTTSCPSSNKANAALPLFFPLKIAFAFCTVEHSEAVLFQKTSFTPKTDVKMALTWHRPAAHYSVAAERLWNLDFIEVANLHSPLAIQRSGGCCWY